MKQLNSQMLDALSQQARLSPRLRANHNLHEELSDPIQRLAIAMEPDTFVRPHRHAQTWELLTVLRGRFVVLLFDDAGTVTNRILLGEDCRVLEFKANTWHAVLSLESGSVIFEVKGGPYAPLAAADFAPWGSEDAAQMNAWYAKARVGDHLAFV